MPWNFGSIGRAMPFSEDNEVISLIEKKIENNTFELAYLLFPNQFSKENLEKYINDLKELKYDKGSIEESKRLRLLVIFDEMLKYKYKSSN